MNCIRTYIRKKIDYGVRNDEVTAQAPQDLDEGLNECSASGKRRITGRLSAKFAPVSIWEGVELVELYGPPDGVISEPVCMQHVI